MGGTGPGERPELPQPSHIQLLASWELWVPFAWGPHPEGTDQGCLSLFNSRAQQSPGSEEMLRSRVWTENMSGLPSIAARIRATNLKVGWREGEGGAQPVVGGGGLGREEG